MHASSRLVSNCANLPSASRGSYVQTARTIQVERLLQWYQQGITYSQMDRQKTTLMVGLHCNDTAASQDLIQLGGFETTYL